MNINKSNEFNIDKLAHFIEYSIFSILIYFTYKERNRKLTLKKIFLISLFPIIDEIHQLFIAGRDFSYYDILANLLGYYFTIILLKHIKRNRRKDES